MDYGKNVEKPNQGIGIAKWMSFFLAEKKLFLADKLFLT
jgi:hypothetical protein